MNRRDLLAGLLAASLPLPKAKPTGLEIFIRRLGNGLICVGTWPAADHNEVRITIQDGYARDTGRGG